MEKNNHEEIESDKMEIIVKLFLRLRPNRATTKAICDSMITDVCARKMLADALNGIHFKYEEKTEEPEEGESWKQ